MTYFLKIISLALLIMQHLLFLCSYFLVVRDSPYIWSYMVYRSSICVSDSFYIKKKVEFSYK